MNRWLEGVFPILKWGSEVNAQTLRQDGMAAVTVTILLIPQSLAYAMLAGMPVETGLYASLLPLVLYALFGSSRSLSVGPMALISLMTATALGNVTQTGASHVDAAIVLALLSGLILIAMGLLRMGWLANWLSHPVLSGFISASAILIAVGQVGYLLGLPLKGDTLVILLPALVKQLPEVHVPTVLFSTVVLVSLLILRFRFQSRMGPIVVVAASIALSYALSFQSQGIRIVGVIPNQLPTLQLPLLDSGLWQQLVVPALLISLVGFVESISIAQTLAVRRRQRISPNQELYGLGAANIASSVSGGFPITASLSRSVVNYESGAKTPLAGMITALLMALSIVFLTPYLHDLPLATLAATIIVAVINLVDLKVIRRTWRYSRGDVMSMLTTIVTTLTLGVELGLLSGLGLAIAIFLFRTSQPHSAVVGLVPGTQHFRNIERHDVETDPHIIIMRVDESLYFANARYLEDRIQELISQNPELRHFVLMCTAVNGIDASALESLEAINQRLAQAEIQFHLSEVKGPVMDRLKRSDLFDQLTGQVFRSQFQAWEKLRKENH